MRGFREISVLVEFSLEICITSALPNEEAKGYGKEGTECGALEMRSAFQDSI